VPLRQETGHEEEAIRDDLGRHQRQTRRFGERAREQIRQHRDRRDQQVVERDGDGDRPVAVEHETPVQPEVQQRRGGPRRHHRRADPQAAVREHGEQHDVQSGAPQRRQHEPQQQEGEGQGVAHRVEGAGAGTVRGDGRDGHFLGLEAVPACGQQHVEFVLATLAGNPGEDGQRRRGQTAQAAERVGQAHAPGDGEDGAREQAAEAAGRRDPHRREAAATHDEVSGLACERLGHRQHILGRVASVGVDRDDAAAGMRGQAVGDAGLERAALAGGARLGEHGGLPGERREDRGGARTAAVVHDDDVAQAVAAQSGDQVDQGGVGVAGGYQHDHRGTLSRG